MLVSAQNCIQYDTRSYSLSFLSIGTGVCPSFMMNELFAFIVCQHLIKMMLFWSFGVFWYFGMNILSSWLLIIFKMQQTILEEERVSMCFLVFCKTLVGGYVYGFGFYLGVMISGQVYRIHTLVTSRVSRWSNKAEHSWFWSHKNVYNYE